MHHGEGRNIPIARAAIDASSRPTSVPAAVRVAPVRVGAVRVVAVLLVLIFLAALVRNAWVSEDVHITLRTIDNFWRGFGLRWNVLERVQTYTHPLWLLLVGSAYGVTREGAFTTLAVSFACTFAVLGLIVRTLSPVRACLALGLIAGSRAFVDFSTSGLENPLSHLLICALWIAVRREADAEMGATPRRLVGLTLIASLIGLTRQDLLLVAMPAVLVEAWRLPVRRAVPALLAGLVPLVAWHAFALIYYGFPFPNTAYAKLATGFPDAMLVRLGFNYLRASFESDPVTLLAIVGGAIAACRSRRDSVVVALPIALYLAYVVKIGGDFMNGRFLTPLFLWAVLALAETRWAARPRPVLAVSAASIALAIAMPESALRVWTGPPPFQSRHGVLNEQTSYYRFSGMIPMLRGTGRPADHDWSLLGRTNSYLPRVAVHMAVGMFGYYGGPGLHIIDELGLGDPLLARVPAAHFNAPGHYQRDVPAWYKAFLERCVARVYPTGAVGHPSGTCLSFRDELPSPPASSADAAAIALYRDLLLITQGPIWDRERLWTIFRLNLTPRDDLTHRVARYSLTRDEADVNAETLKGHLDLLLLAAVDGRPSHGYAIAETLRARSGGAFDLPEGTLYPALHRLERAKLLSSKWSEVNGRRRRVYQLTSKGQRALTQRHGEWRDFARAMYAVVDGPAAAKGSA